MANRYAIAPGVVQLASGASVLVDAGALWASGNAVVAAAPALFTSQPALPASTVAVTNTNPVSLSVAITGGTVTVITLNGTVTGLTTGTFTVVPGGTLAVTYSVAPTWTVSDIAPTAGAYPFVNSVAAGYLASYPNGPQVS